MKICQSRSITLRSNIFKTFQESSKFSCNKISFYNQSPFQGWTFHQALKICCIISAFIIYSLYYRNYRPEIIAHIIAVCGRLINMKVSGHHVIHHQINLDAKSDSSPILNQSENVTEKHAISPDIFNGNLWYFYGKTQILVLLILHTRKWRLTYTV